jgi:two-component SAPR family response regulator
MPCGHFEAYAWAYLLKTVDDERFAAAIDRARKLLDATSKTQMAGRI